MAKEKEYRKLQCLNCTNLTMMELVNVYSEVKHIENEYENGPPIEEGDVYEILKCPACSQITFRKYFWNDYMDGDDYSPEYEILYPISKKMPLGLPQNIQKGFEAATKVKKVDANAYGVLIRRVLEMMCSDRQATGKSLYAKLQALSTNGEIPSKLIDVAQHLKDFGNVGAHADLGELTDAEIPILEDLCRAILEYVYSAPYLAQKAQNSLAALKK